MGAKRVAFRTFGCRLNQYDTETLRTLLEASGRYRTVGSGDEAEVYVVNTCSVTSRADATARKAIRRIHAEHPEAKIVVAGCYAQRAPDEVAGVPGVSLVIGAADRGGIVPAVDLLDGVNDPSPRIAVSPIAEAKTFLDLSITEMMERSRAFVKVQEGCNESCTFCIIPQTRGASRSREPDRVIDQIRELVESGYVEIVATGVHIGDYGLDLPGSRRALAELIRRILEIPGLLRFRLSSIEPASVSGELIEMMASEDRFARHFHIPLQSASDPVLDRMERRYTAADFRRLIERIAHAVPGCGIGTDVICGFPGESEADFGRTFDCLESLPITYIHPFSYSVRPGSRAEQLGDQVSGDEKKRRTRSLKRLSAEKGRMARESHLGETLSVLPEAEVVDPATGAVSVTGWSDNYLKIRMDASLEALGSAPRRVRVVAQAGDQLIGEPVA